MSDTVLAPSIDISATRSDRSGPTRAWRPASSSGALASTMTERDNASWLKDLREEGPAQTRAIEELRDFLRRAAHYTLGRAQGEAPRRAPTDVVATAEDCAQEALVAVLSNLDRFRGDSKLTTWSYKFAVNIALTAARSARWRDIRLDEMLEDTGWPDAPTVGGCVSGDQAVLQAEVWSMLRDLIDHKLNSPAATSLAGDRLGECAARRGGAASWLKPECRIQTYSRRSLEAEDPPGRARHPDRRYLASV